MSIGPQLLLIALVSLLCAIALPAESATTYYVATTGSDTNPGTGSLPWRTIQKCANSILGGDTCIVKAGTYTGNVTFSRNGSAGNLMVFQAEVKQTAIVNGVVEFSVGSSYNKIDGLKVVMPDSTIWGVNTDGSYNQVWNTYVTTNSTSLQYNNVAFRTLGSHQTITGNLADGLCFGSTLFGDNHTYSNNEIRGLSKTAATCGDMDYLRFFGTNHVIDKNYFHGVDPLPPINVAHVDCFQNFDNGGTDYGIHNVVISNNYCTNSHQGMLIEGDYFHSSSGLIVRNNIFRGTDSACGVIGNIQDTHIYNNVCDQTGTSQAHGIDCLGPSGNYGTCEFKNNIFYNATGYGVGGTDTLIDGTAGTPGKNNLLYRSGYTFTGYANDIRNLDPLFVNRASGDYSLQSGSPAINAGISIPQWTNPTDRQGIARPQGPAWDIGAYEFQGNVTSPGKFPSPIREILIN